MESDFQQLVASDLGRQRGQLWSLIGEGGFGLELKLSLTGRALPVASVQEHQIEALRRCAGDEGLYFKLTDASVGQKPFDCFYLRRAKGYLLLGWHDAGKREVRCYLVNVKKWAEIVCFVSLRGRKSVKESDIGSVGGMARVDINEKGSRIA